LRIPHSSMTAALRRTSPPISDLASPPKSVYNGPIYGSKPAWRRAAAISIQASGAGNPVYLTSKWSRAIARVPQFPCTIIEAPIGYGKTTFTAEATARLPERIVRQKFYEKSAS